MKKFGNARESNPGWLCGKRELCYAVMFHHLYKVNLELKKGFSVLAQGKLVDATQEFIALGMSNLVGSFFHSMPVAASFGRTAVNSASSAKTTLVSGCHNNAV